MTGSAETVAPPYEKEPGNVVRPSSTAKDLDGSIGGAYDDVEKGGLDTKHASTSIGSADDGFGKDEKVVVDPYVVDFEGPEDPTHPYNWAFRMKVTNGAFLAALTFITPLASSMFAPGVPRVMKEFNSSSTILSSLVVSIYVLGYACGPLLVAPLSEVYGRKWVYHGSNVLFVIFTIACAVSTNLGMLIAFRLLAGMVGSTPLTIGGGTMADMFDIHQRGSAMAVWSLGPLLGPVVGPVAGGFLTESKGWRWVFWLITIVAGAITIAMLIFMRETHAGTILEGKAKRLRKETGDSQYKSKLDSGLSPRDLFLRSIVRPIKMLIFSPIVLFLSIYMAVVYGYMYLLFTTLTQVFEDIYKFSPGSVGLTYLGLGVGMFIGLFISGMTSDRGVKYLTQKNGGVYKPEFRLPLMVPAALFVPAGLFIYGWTARASVPYIVPIIGTSLVGVGMITTFMPIMTYLIDSYTLYAASVTAANTVLRSACGAFVPLAGPAMYAKLGLGWGNSLLGFIALALVPLPFFFWKFGERIRTSKRWAVQF